MLGVATHTGELLQCATLLAGEAGGHFDVYADELVAGAAGAELGHAFAADAEGGAALRGGRDLERGLAGEGGHFDGASQGGEGELDRDLAEEIVAVALEQLVLLDGDDDADIYR